MNELYELLLPKPLGPGWVWPLLFAAFAAHLLFALLTLGTALLAVVYHLASRKGRRPALENWDKFFMKRFFVYKSVAVVLGIAPLLLMQVSRTVPFVTATSLLAGQWMLIFVLLIAAFLLLEALAARSRKRRTSQIVLGAAGLGCLLAVPAIFVAVVATTENSAQWATIHRSGFFSSALGGHWLARLLHALGAAVVFAAALHAFRAPKQDARMRRHLLYWILGGLGFQIVIGLQLYASLPHPPSWSANVWIAAGAAGAFAALGAGAYAILSAREPRRAVVALPFGLVFLPMLLARQDIQDKALEPHQTAYESRAGLYEARLQPYRSEALSHFQARNLVSYDRPATVYMRACAFCHGTVGNGLGDDAHHLRIAPADLSAIRTSDKELTRILRQGVRGTAMPTFGMYTRRQLSGLSEFLRLQIGLGVLPEPSQVSLAPQTRKEARTIFAQSCSLCHGHDGRATELSRRYSPPPPDFTVFALTAPRAFRVITEGYPGTMMASYSMLPEELRWALVDIVHGFYLPPNDSISQGWR